MLFFKATSVVLMEFGLMKRSTLVIPAAVLLAAWAASKQEARVPYQSQRTVQSQRTLTVSHDLSGNPFIGLNHGERLGIDLNGYDPEKHSQFVQTFYKDKNGGIVADFDMVTPVAELL